MQRTEHMLHLLKKGAESRAQSAAFSLCLISPALVMAHFASFCSVTGSRYTCLSYIDSRNVTEESIPQRFADSYRVGAVLICWFFLDWLDWHSAAAKVGSLLSWCGDVHSLNRTL